MNNDGFSQPAEPYRAPSRVKVGPDGRIRVPAGLRREAGIVPGATVMVEVNDGEVLI